MLASEKPETIADDDLLFLLDALMHIVRHTDEWDRWVGEDDWTDGKVYRALEIIYERIAST